MSGMIDKLRDMYYRLACVYYRVLRAVERRRIARYKAIIKRGWNNGPK